MSPVTGAAIQRMGMFSTFAPSVSNILLTFAFCRAKPNWIPRNPKLIFQTCQKERFGFDFFIKQIYYPGLLGNLLRFSFKFRDNGLINNSYPAINLMQNR